MEETENLSELGGTRTAALQEVQTIYSESSPEKKWTELQRPLNITEDLIFALSRCSRERRVGACKVPE